MIPRTYGWGGGAAGGPSFPPCRSTPGYDLRLVSYWSTWIGRTSWANTTQGQGAGWGAWKRHAHLSHSHIFTSCFQFWNKATPLQDMLNAGWVQSCTASDPCNTQRTLGLFQSSVKVQIFCHKLHCQSVKHHLCLGPRITPGKPP